MTAASILRQALADKDFFVAPGMHDMIAAKLAAGTGFRFGYASGYWLMASAHALPDAGIATYSQMVERIGTLVDVTRPMAIIADADTGYGGLLNVRQTMRGYEKAGVAAVQLEDQEFPKRCGHTKGKKVVPVEEMVARITVAREARSGPDGPVIIARSDAKQAEGVESMLRRLEAYAAAGAEMLFPEALADEEEMAFVAARLPLPAMANMADGGSTRILPASVLKDIGYAGAIFPALTALVSAAATQHALSRLKQSGTSLHDDVKLFAFEDFCRLIGFEDVWAFDERWKHLGIGDRTA